MKDEEFIAQHILKMKGSPLFVGQEARDARRRGYSGHRPRIPGPPGRPHPGAHRRHTEVKGGGEPDRAARPRHAADGRRPHRFRQRPGQHFVGLPGRPRL